MKKLRSAIRVVSMLLVVAFVGLGAWMGYTVYTQGSRWLTTQYNTRLTTARRSVGMGDITDRTGALLATTDTDGVRQYAADKATRRALSQTVGDQMSMSGTGVETFHAGTLLGLSGSIIDRTWQYVTGQPYQGENIRLTVSAALSAYISDIFPSGKSGAVAVINYKTGEVLAMVSKPDYDPSKLNTRQSSAEEDTAYLNRCLQGQYAPGSIFKVVTLAAALKNLPGIEQETFTCEGTRAFGEGKVTCAGGAVHGKLTLHKAFAVSCNVTFAELALRIGADKLNETARQMGFNVNFRFRDLVLYESTIPDDIADVSELAWSGVGQGRLIVTPLHMAMITGAVANDGVMMQPQLVRQVTGVGGIPRLRTALAPYGRVLSAEIAASIAADMRLVVTQGTGANARIKGQAIAGKTGTAEISDDKRVKTNAWFIGYIDAQETPYAVAVIVEQAGSGSAVAAPVAAKALKKAISLTNS